MRTTSINKQWFTHLLFIKNIDHRYVHRTNILALTFRSGWIVEHEKVLHNLFVYPIAINVVEVVHFYLLCVTSTNLESYGNLHNKTQAKYCTSLYVGFAVAVGGPMKPTRPLHILEPNFDLKNFSVPQ